MERLQGHADAQYWMGLAHYIGQSVEKDDMEAVWWWTQAAEQGHARAQERLMIVTSETEMQFTMGYAYEHGEGMEQSMVKAFRWYTKAANQGHSEAQDALTRLMDEPVSDHSAEEQVNGLPDTFEEILTEISKHRVAFRESLQALSCTS